MIELAGETVVIIVDGASKGNPGPSAIAVALWVRGPNKDPGRAPDETVSKLIGRATNNVAEHRAIQEGLDLAWKRRAVRVYLFSDSQVAVEHINGDAEVKAAHLQELAETTRKMIEQDAWTVEIVWLPRELTGRADGLADQAFADAPQRETSLLEQVGGRGEEPREQ